MSENGQQWVKYFIISLTLLMLLVTTAVCNLRNQRTANELCAKHYARSKLSQSDATSRNASTQDGLEEAFMACIH